MILTEQDLRERVALGVKWLDGKKPDWREHIDKDRLNLLYCERCVIGQLFGMFDSIVDNPDVHIDGDKMLSIGEAYAMGFSVTYVEELEWEDEDEAERDIFNVLTDLWKEVLAS